MNLPNKLTISRIVLIPVCMYFLFAKMPFAKAFALITFLAASLTDLVDGFIAKRKNQITDFGKLMDPIADKLLVLAAFLAFVEMELVPAWMVVVIIFREVAITGLRVFAVTKGKIIPADHSGKHKTVSQAISIFVILIFLILKDAGIRVPGYAEGIFVLMLATVILTLISGLSYLIKNKEVYLNAHAD